MLLIFGAAKLFAEIFERFKQPGIVGEILAGAIIGPGLLNWIQPNETLTSLADLGVMFLLFRVGLEVKSSELMKVGGTAFLVATTGVIVPFILGWGILTAWHHPVKEAVFVGAAMVATSVGITAQVLAAKGLLHLKSSKIILGAAVIDDILGLLVLAVVSSFAKGEVNLVAIATTTFIAAGFTIVLAVWGTRAMGTIVPHVQKNLHAGEVQFNLALLFLFAMSVLAIYAGVAAIVGAFLAGMALAETVDRRVQDLASGVSELLVPFFLAGIGLKLEFSVFSNPSILLLAIVVLIAAVVSKWIGCGLGAYSLGRLEMMRIGVGMVPRGEVGMVVAQIGLGMGIIEKPVYAVVVFMAIMTTIVSPPMITMAFRGAEVKVEEERFQLG